MAKPVATARQAALRVAAACDARKGTEIVVLNVQKQTFITEYFVVATSQNERHSRAIAEEAEARMKEIGAPAVGREGLDTGTWVLVDFGDVVLHVLTPREREFYGIERLWADAPRVRTPGPRSPGTKRS